MAIKLASLFIELAADGGKLTAEFTKTKKGVKSWERSITKASDIAGKALKRTAIAGTIAAAGLATLYSTNAVALDNLGKTASKLGDTTEELRTFGVAAEYGGVGADSANVALQRMTRRLAEAKEGTGEAKGAINELGLDAAALAAKRPSEAFAEIAAELETIPLAADRVRLAMKFFDSEGVALVNVTRDVLQRAANDVEALGGALTSIEVAQIEAANDSVFRLRTGFGLLTDRLTFKLSPAVKAVSDSLFESATQSVQLQNAIDVMVDDALAGFSDLLRGTGRVLEFVDNRPELATAGVVGYLFGGKLGVLAGTAATASFDSLSASFDYYKSKFDLTLSDAERAEIALRKIVTRQELLNTPGIGSIVANKDEQLVQLEEQRRAVVTILSDMGEFDRITQTLFTESVGAVGTLGAALQDLGDNIDRSTSETRVLLDKPAVPGIVLDGVTDGETPSDTEDDEVDEKAKRRADYFAAQLSSIEQFQNTWTLFEESGAKDRLKILSKETSGALAALSEHSRTMFELNKAVGLANATVYIAEGISASWKLGWPAGVAAAATVALNGAAQIKAITSAKFGSATVATPTSGSTTTTDVSSVNSGVAANDSSITGDSAAASTNNLVFFGFHTPGATDEQKADEQARLLQIAQDNDLLVRNSDGGFDYTGTGSSNYVSPEFEAVG